MDNHVVFNNINLSYQDYTAARTEVFNNLSFIVNRGEFVSIIGPSGCGKTTILKIICGLLHAEGCVTIDGLNVDQAKQKRLFTYVFQNPVLLKWRSVKKNITLPAEISNVSVDNEHLEELIKLVGLQGFEEAYPDMLSGGMQSRVQIARALLLNPEGLALDECFGSLDEITRFSLNMELLRIWSASKATIIFVTHSVEEAVFLSDRVLVFGQRPHGLCSTINIDLPRPRNVSIRDSEEFRKYLKQVRESLASGYAYNTYEQCQKSSVITFRNIEQQRQENSEI